MTIRVTASVEIEDDSISDEDATQCLFEALGDDTATVTITHVTVIPPAPEDIGKWVADTESEMDE